MPYPKSSGKARKNYTPQFKFNLAKEAIKTGNVSEISRKYNVNANVVSRWVQQFDEHGYHIFETTPDQQNKQLKGKVAKLEQLVGKKEVELNLLKNFSDFYQSQNPE